MAHCSGMESTHITGVETIPETARPAAVRRGVRPRAVLPWLVGGGLYAAVYATALGIIGSLPPDQVLRWTLVNVAPDLLLAPAVVALVRRAPWGPTPPGRFLLIHLGGAVLFVTASIALWWMAERSLIGGERSQSVRAVLAWKGFMTLLVYTALCGIGQALAFADRARHEAARAARAELLGVRARLEALRSQLNPHFILNLLHSLAGIAGRDADRAAAMIERLGDLLRYVVRVQKEDADLVAFRDEWRFVLDYLDLESMRLRERLRVERAVDDTALDAVVPPFVLQPLVENAVRHAIAPRAAGGILALTVRRDGQHLVLVVEDDGPGPEVASAAPGSGSGLRLVRERLAAVYGEAASLEVGRSARGGFRAAVRLPAEPPGEETE
jgi:two-component system LytT family sensor kinase